MNIKKAKISRRALLQFLLKQKVNDRDDWIALRQTKDVLELLRNKHIRHGYYVCGQILPSGCTKRKKLIHSLFGTQNNFVCENRELFNEKKSKVLTFAFFSIFCAGN